MNDCDANDILSLMLIFSFVIKATTRPEQVWIKIRIIDTNEWSCTIVPSVTPRFKQSPAQMICFYLYSLGGTNVKLGLKVRGQARCGELIRRIDCDTGIL